MPLLQFRNVVEFNFRGDSQAELAGQCFSYPHHTEQVVLADEHPLIQVKAENNLNYVLKKFGADRSETACISTYSYTFIIG